MDFAAAGKTHMDFAGEGAGKTSDLAGDLGVNGRNRRAEIY